jgi:hypothetical protein
MEIVMATQSFNARPTTSTCATKLVARGIICLATMGLAVVAGPASADELEDMLSRLVAAGAIGSPIGGTTNVTAANGVVGAIVSGSANGSQGIMALNQDASLGGATQANVVVVALSNGLNAAAIARLLAEQTYAGQVPTPDATMPDIPNVAALAIVDSYKGGAGIAQINQSAGVGNVQRNATIIAAALGGGDASAITEADLASMGSINRSASPTPGTRGLASVTGSFTDFSGIVQVNQTIGTGNLVSNTVSFTYGSAVGGGG